MCKSTMVKKTVHAVGNKEADSDDAWVGAVNKENATAWFVTVEMLQGNIKMKVDTGAEANVIPTHMWTQFKERPPLQKSATTLKTADDTEIAKNGVATIKMSVGGTTITDTVYVTKTGQCAILGLKTSTALKLVTPGRNGGCLQIHSLTVKTLVDSNLEVFTGLGLYPDEYHIQLKEDARPVIQPPRRVPHVLYDALKKKLDEMLKNGVIATVEKPTKWVNSLVIAKKADGTLRLCLDPKDLNRCIERELFEIPTFEQIISTLGGKKYFSTLDQKDSYWQVKLDEESSLLTTFNTPFGRYRFLRMPFGISSASEILQRNTYKVFGDIENVHCLSDDMLIATATEEEQDRTVLKVMERARQYGVKFNAKKIQFKQPEITYMGREITAEGIKPDPTKIKVIQNMPLPTDTHAVKRLLGMVNFLAPFIPEMATITNPLRNLLKKDMPWNWQTEHTEAVELLKKILSKEPVLKLYESSKKSTIQCDSSSTGLGACLLQDDRPIAYASRSLTNTEMKYAQIEKEMLAIVFAAEHFHQYIYGQEIEVLSDHKPIETILRKPLHKASPRLQLMMLRLLRYKLQVKFTPGSKMYIADTLSRAYQTEGGKIKKFEEDSLRVHSLSSAVPATKTKLEQIREETAADNVLSNVLQFIKDGEWPQATKNEDQELKRFRPILHELSQEKGIIFFGERMLIPESLRKETLNNLHKGHLGIEKSKAKARQSIYWPGMSQDIDKMVRKCQVCAKHQTSKPREPLLQHDIPQQPWRKLGADIFAFQGKDYLVVVDYYSKYPEVAMLRGKGASSVVEVMKPIFARQGIPEELIADNNPFGSREMRQFAKEWDFKITTSSPLYPQSNGQAERFVNIVKTILKKCKEDRTDPNIALLAYRNCPITGLQFSPAQLLMNRQLRDLTTQIPKGLTNREAWKQMRGSRQKTKQFYDRRSHASQPFTIGQPVRVMQGGKWERNVVCGHGNTPRSYLVEDEYGKILRRNSSVIRPSQHTPTTLKSRHTFDDNDIGCAPAANQRASCDVSSPCPTATDSKAGSSETPPLQDTLTQALRPEVRPTSEPQSQTNATYITRSGRSVRKPTKYTC